MLDLVAQALAGLPDGLLDLRKGSLNLVQQLIDLVLQFGLFDFIDRSPFGSTPDLLSLLASAAFSQATARLVSGCLSKSMYRLFPESL